jgi:mycothiol synthase
MTETTMGRRIEIDDAPPIPGLVFRHWTGEADLPGMFAVSSGARAADGEVEPITLEAMTVRYRHLVNCDLDRDLLVVELDGRIVGYARIEWADSNDGERWYDGTCLLLPDARRRGIGAAMLRWSEGRRHEIRAEHVAARTAPSVPTYLTTFVFDGDAGGHALLRRHGYEVRRRFHEMVRPGLESIPDVPLPDGLEVRAIARDHGSIRRVFDADVEAFRDHFGWVDGSETAFDEFANDPDADPSLWVVAFDGDEVAGAVINGIHGGNGPERQGWLDSVFTRRPWRRRGLARALIVRSLALLRDRGLDAAYLGVDATNPNEAFGLYESCGFAIVSGATAFRKPMGGSVRLRPYRGPTDHPAMVDANNLARAAAGLRERLTVEAMDVDYASLTNSDLERDLRIAEIDGRVVGYGRIEWGDRNSGERAFETICHVRPDAQGQGVGRALLAFQLDRIGMLAAEMADDLGDRPSIIAAYAFGSDDRAVRLLERNGFAIARRHAQLVRPNLDAIPAYPLPDDLEIRPIDPRDEAAVRRAFDVDAEVFRDHWGGVDASDAAWRRFRASPAIQPELWQVAFDRDSGEVAGQILNYVAPADDGDVIGWTESIAVRRPYRRRGVARALLAASLRRVREAGAGSAALGVDTQNENRPLDLYESLGFRIVARQLELHRPVGRPLR